MLFVVSLSFNNGSCWHINSSIGSTKTQYNHKFHLIQWILISLALIIIKLNYVHVINNPFILNLLNIFVPSTFMPNSLFIECWKIKKKFHIKSHFKTQTICKKIYELLCFGFLVKIPCFWFQVSLSFANLIHLSNMTLNWLFIS